ncbi:hypothetical protein ABGV42_02030 [Paenibacillus pabuli]|uniref:hypothetical protein n=1 Tax=Paenibacillus pabuli TaxID=1472 RepID=UPI0032423291
MNNKPVVPFYMKVDSDITVWVLQNESLVMKAIRHGLGRMRLRQSQHADEIYSAFLTYFVERPAREELAEQMDNLEGFIYKEAFNFTRTYSVSVFRRKEHSIYDDSENERYEGGKGIPQSYLKAESLTPEEMTLVKSECDHIYDKLDLYDVYFRQEGMPKRFYTKNWVTAAFILGGPTKDIAYALGISESTFEGWNRKIRGIMERDSEKFTDLMEDIKTLIGGSNSGWEPAIEYEEEYIEDEDTGFNTGFRTDMYGIENSI